MTERFRILSRRWPLGLLAALALAAGIVSDSKDARALPCIPQGLDQYLASGFSCTLGFGAWQVSQFSFLTISGHHIVPPSEVPNNIIVTPFGGTQRAGLQFDLLEPLNAVPASTRFLIQLDYTIQLLSGPGIRSASLSVPTIFAGPPDGNATVVETICLGTLWTVSGCATGHLQLSEVRFGSSSPIMASPVIFDPVFLIDTFNQVFIYGDANDPVELPGGARVDGFAMAFNTNVIPEPGTLALFAFGLAGLGFMTRRRRRQAVA